MSNDTAEERAILSVIRDLQDAWSRGDAAGYAAAFTDDASFVTWNGLHGYGRAAIEEAHRHLFAGSLAGSTMLAEPDSLRLLGPEAAVLVTVGAVTPAEHTAVQTFVLVKRREQWRIAAFHNTRRDDRA